MKFGLSNSEFQLLHDLVLQPLKDRSTRIYVFGSRATGKNHPFSDLDLLLVPSKANPLESSELSSIKEAIEESRFPIRVDFVLSDQLANSYRARVDSEKIEI